MYRSVLLHPAPTIAEAQRPKERIAHYTDGWKAVKPSFWAWLSHNVDMMGITKYNPKNPWKWGGYAWNSEQKKYPRIVGYFLWKDVLFFSCRAALGCFALTLPFFNPHQEWWGEKYWGICSSGDTYGKYEGEVFGRLSPDKIEGQDDEQDSERCVDRTYERLLYWVSDGDIEFFPCA